MPGDWTIDTYVLYKAAENRADAVFLLLRILRSRDFVFIDAEGNIEAEYRRCLRGSQRHPGYDLLRKWFTEAVAKLICRVPWRLPKHVLADFEEMGFDDDDWPFAGVCVRSATKRLVAEESDYTDEVKAYLRDQMTVRVLAIEEACDDTLNGA